MAYFSSGTSHPRPGLARVFTALRNIPAWRAAFFLCLAWLCLPFWYGAATANPTAAPMLPPALTAPSMPLLPSLRYFIDDTGTMDVEEVAAQANAQSFQPLVLKALPRETGVMWLRFTLAPLPEGARPGTVLLDLGPSVPGEPALYEPFVSPVSEAIEWRETLPSQRNVLLLPEAVAEPQTCYIRLDGLPGLWFAPMLRTPQDAASNWGSLSSTAAMLALAVVMLLCLLRGLSEKGQWRVWTALYVAVALAQALMGMPAYGSGHVTFKEAAAVLAPGVALMLLPHVGRHLIRAKSRSRILDIQFLLLSLPGAVLALLPLLPGFGWLIRYLDLWPLGTLIFVPSALGAAIMGLGGARRFLLGCLLPPLFVAGGVLGLDSGFAANLLASAPLWGTALSALLIAATGAPRDMAPDREHRATGAAEGAEPRMEDGAITLEQPLDDPNLRLVPPLGVPEPSATATKDAAGHIHATATAQGPDQELLPGVLEDALRLPLDRLMREGAALGHCALPPAVRQYAENMLDAAREMAQIISNPEQLHQENHSGGARGPFNLQHLMREAHDIVAPAAESAGIGLAWYMPPHLGHMYEGEAKALSQTLCLLLESAVRATRHGAVHFSVRRVPESADAGHLLFTVTDTGSGMPPQDRSSLALTRAWELAGAHQGFLGVECSPHGATIAFTLHLKYLEQAEAEEAVTPHPHVIIAAENAVDRQSLARLLIGLPCRSSEARDLNEALQLSKEHPALLLVVQAPPSGSVVADALRRFLDDALAAGLPFCHTLAITRDDSQWDALADAGFTHALLEPVDSEAFCRTVRDALEQAAAEAAVGDGVQDARQSETAPAEGGAVTSSPHEHEDACGSRWSAASGRPPLPDLFGQEAGRDKSSPLKIPDLTALPDLLSFAESLRTAPEDEDGAAASGAGKASGGLFSHLPHTGSPLSDMPELQMPGTEGTSSASVTKPASRRRKDGKPRSVPAAPAPGLFVNPYAPDDLIMPTAAPGAVQSDPVPENGPEPSGTAQDAELDSVPNASPDILYEHAHGSAAQSGQNAMQAEFTSAAGFEGPIWAGEEAVPEQTPADRPAEKIPEKTLAEHAEDAGALTVAESPAAAEETLESTSSDAPPAALSNDAALPEAALSVETTSQESGSEEMNSEAPEPEVFEPETPARDSQASPHEEKAPETVETPAQVEDAPPLAAEDMLEQEEEATPQETTPEQAVQERATPAGEQPVTPDPALASASAPPAASEPQTEPSLQPQRVRPAKPLRFAVHPAAPKPVAAARVGFSPVSPKESASVSDAYTSPSLSTPGEWVGEPVPVGTPLPSRSASEELGAQAAPPKQSQAAQPAAMPTPAKEHQRPRLGLGFSARNAKSASPADQAAQPRDIYTSPSLSTPGEWVGEPVPVSKKNANAAGNISGAESRQPQAPQPRKIVQAVLTEPAARAVASPAPEKPAPVAPGMPHRPSSPDQGRSPLGGSFMDFIAGTADMEADSVPAPRQLSDLESHRPEPEEAAPATARAEPLPDLFGPVADSGPQARPASQPEVEAGTRAASPPAEAAFAAAARQSEQQSRPPDSPQSGPDETIPHLVARLDAAMEDAQQGFTARRPSLVGEAAARIASESDAYGFRVLARMARCVERAAKANDMNALKDLLPELAVAVERNRIALSPRR